MCTCHVMSIYVDNDGDDDTCSCRNAYTSNGSKVIAPETAKRWRCGKTLEGSDGQLNSEFNSRM
jgi:hypothetical protein